MLTLTIQEAMDSAEKTQEPCIYLYRDDETIFYIGRSEQPCERLRQHLGQGVYIPYPDAIGSLILDNAPASHLWTMEVWTVQELAPDRYQEALTYGRVSWLVESLESSLITQMKPCLNKIHRTYRNPLPARYVTRRIANAGVKLD